MKRPVIWALLLPEAGFRSQVMGLAETLNALVRGTVIEKNVDLRAPWRYLPSTLCPLPLSGLTANSDRLEAPWPDLVIGCGRRTIPLALAIKRVSAGATKAVFIQDAKAAAPEFDLVFPMHHDGLQGPNVIAVDTALHRVTSEKLETGREQWRARFEGLKRPLIGVVLGGSNASLRFTEACARDLVSKLEHLARDTGAGFVITPSRRTDESALTVIRDFASRQHNIWMWDGQNDNPYFGILGLSDALIVTEDSVSMVSEALVAGKPVATVSLEGHARRHKLFIDNLRAKGAITRFDGSLPPASSVTLPNATQHAADAVRDLLGIGLTVN
jgi:uncharacterized protein